MTKYNKFISWYCLNNVLCGIETVFSTHNMFGALSISNDSLNFSLNYIGKDVIGQVIGLGIVSKFAKCGDKNIKQYVIINSIIYESAALLESCTPLFDPSYFLAAGITGNIFRNIAFNGFGAVRMKAINKLSTEHNITEIYTKINVASTLSYSFGMIIGLGLIKLIPCHLTRIGMLPIIGISRYYTFTKSLNSII